MNLEVGDRVLVKDQSIRGKILQIGLDPRKMLVRLDTHREDWFWAGELISIPPKHALFDYGDSVKIGKTYPRRLMPPYHYCVPQLVGCVGRIIGYDSRDGFYLVESIGQGSGWFPTMSLIPTNYQGETFYYPGEEVRFNAQKTKISAVRRTKSDRGQILLINGEWIPSSQVKRC